MTPAVVLVVVPWLILPLSVCPSAWCPLLAGDRHAGPRAERWRGSGSAKVPAVGR